MQLTDEQLAIVHHNLNAHAKVLAIARPVAQLTQYHGGKDADGGQLRQDPPRVPRWLTTAQERCLRQAAESPPTYLVFLSASFCSAVSRPLTFSATLPQSPGSRPSLK